MTLYDDGTLSVEWARGGPDRELGWLFKIPTKRSIWVNHYGYYEMRGGGLFGVAGSWDNAVIHVVEDLFGLQLPDNFLNEI